MVNIQDLFDDAKGFLAIRQRRWLDGVSRPRCSSDSTLNESRNDDQPLRQRYP